MSTEWSAGKRAAAWAVIIATVVGLSYAFKIPIWTITFRIAITLLGEVLNPFGFSLSHILGAAIVAVIGAGVMGVYTASFSTKSKPWNRSTAPDIPNAKWRAAKTAGGWALAIVVGFGLSYASAYPKYQAETKLTAEFARRLPGGRLISSVRTADIASPVTWLWPTMQTLTFGYPEPLSEGRFYTISVFYEDLNPLTLLVDIDCETREEIFYGLDEPASALPALDLFGEPVVAPNGQTYRRLPATTKQTDYPAEWPHAFCDADWEAERNAIRKARTK